MSRYVFAHSILGFVFLDFVEMESVANANKIVFKTEEKNKKQIM